MTSFPRCVLTTRLRTSILEPTHEDRRRINDLNVYLALPNHPKQPNDEYRNALFVQLT